MWNDVFSAVKQLSVLNEQTQLNKEEIKELRRGFKALEDEVNNLSSLVGLLAHDNIRMREEIQNARREEAKERENLALRLENEMLKFERRLPSGDVKEND